MASAADCRFSTEDRRQLRPQAHVLRLHAELVRRDLPPAIVERGKLGDTLIVEATCDKYLEHMPIERQCSRLEKYGVEIAPQTLRRSVAAHIDLLMPVARLIGQQARGPGLLGTDATGIRCSTPP